MYTIPEYVIVEDNIDMNCKVLLDLLNGKAYVLNKAASRILEEIQKQGVPDAYYEELGYMSGRARIDGDSYCNDLVRKGLLLYRDAKQCQDTI